VLARAVLVALPLVLAATAPLAAQAAEAPAPACAVSCDRVPRPVGYYIRAVDDGGRYITLEDGTVWEVEISDRATTGSWAADDFVRLHFIAAPRGDFEYLLSRQGDQEQHAAARLAARARG
jgi:hypothetical protein